MAITLNESKLKQIIKEVLSEINETSSCAVYLFSIQNDVPCILAGIRSGQGLANVPVGMKEESDESDLDCALREFQEETGSFLPSNLIFFTSVLLPSEEPPD